MKGMFEKCDGEHNWLKVKVHRGTYPRTRFCCCECCNARQVKQSNDSEWDNI